MTEDQPRKYAPRKRGEPKFKPRGQTGVWGTPSKSPEEQAKTQERLTEHAFGAGHELSVKHGAGDLQHPNRPPPRRVLVLAQQFADAYLDGYCPPQLEMPQFLPAVEAWARSEARVRLLNDWIDGMSIEEMTSPPERKGASAAVKVPVELLMQAENQAAKRRKDLGLDPASWASIQKDLGIAGRAADDAVARMGQAGAAIRSRRQASVTVLRDGDQAGG